MTFLSIRYKLYVTGNTYRNKLKETIICHLKTNWNKQQALSKKVLVKLLETARQNEGAVEKTVAKAKDVVEDAKGAVEGAVEGLKNVFPILINNFLRRLYLLGRILSCPG